MVDKQDGMDQLTQRSRYTVLLLSFECLPIVTAMADVCGHLNECRVAQAVQLVQDGTPVIAFAQRFGVSSSTVTRLWTIFQQTGLYTKRPG